MEIYNGIIENHFLKAEIEFIISLPAFCEDQKFELCEIIDRAEVPVEDFALLINNRSVIVQSSNSIVVYTGPIEPIYIETTVIAQVEIEKVKVSNFRLRKFKLKVL